MTLIIFFFVFYLYLDEPGDKTMVEETNQAESKSIVEKEELVNENNNLKGGERSKTLLRIPIGGC